MANPEDVQKAVDQLDKTDFEGRNIFVMIVSRPLLHFRQDDPNKQGTGTKKTKGYTPAQYGGGGGGDGRGEGRSEGRGGGRGGGDGGFKKEYT